MSEAAKWWVAAWLFMQVAFIVAQIYLNAQLNGIRRDWERIECHGRKKEGGNQ